MKLYFLTFVKKQNLVFLSIEWRFLNPYRAKDLSRLYGSDVDQPIHVSHLCLICGFVDICARLYLAFYVKMNQYRTEDNCVHMSYQRYPYELKSHASCGFNKNNFETKHI